ncbi:MAG: beta-phosphoglucomutase [Flavobacteriaceae bacterium]|nr:beta-phosphoglucomutase [Flavobacteriaceae bacterium]
MDKIGFIFDLDGVIVDTAKYHFLAWKDLATKLRIDFDEAFNEQLKGVSRVRSLEKILDRGGVKLSDEEFQAYMAEKNEDYLEYIGKMSPDEILPGVIDILSYLKSREIPFALGSASKNARTILEQVELSDWFAAVVDGTDVTLAKPDPEVFLIAAERLDIDPKDCIVVEDSIAGIQAANTAKMVSIGIGDPGFLHEADVVFKDFTEIKKQFIEDLITHESGLYKT